MSRTVYCVSVHKYDTVQQTFNSQAFLPVSFIID